MNANAADSDLLFGMLALQNGLIDQDQLVAAFRRWTRDRSRRLAECLVARGDLDPEQCAGVEAMVGLHLKKHGGDAAKSLAAIPAGRATCESLAALGDPAIERTISKLAAADGDAELTATYSAGSATSDSQRFRILRPHARGGLGAVFVALDNELYREVALKQILDDRADDPLSRQRFLIEAEITGGLEHPGIVPVYGLSSYSDGRPFYAMRFIRGDSLKEAIDSFHGDGALKKDPGRRALELRRLLGQFVDICNAIEYAHSRGVLHRDIKPANVIVGKHGETLVLDWGLAKATGRADPDGGERTLMPRQPTGSTDTLPGSALGTPSYMSPEQAEGDIEHLSAQSDVYSLGATLYCLLAGRPPLQGDVADVLRAVRRGEFPPPRQVVPDIDPALEAACLKAMAMRPADRYDSARALAEEIERWMADEPVTAWREPVSRRARRWIGRHRTSVTAAAVALVVGVVALGSVTGVQARANAALKVANKATSDALARTREAQIETENALTQSEEARQEAQAVSNFLVDAFRSPDPTQDGRQVKVADVLDRASARIQQGFAGSSVTKAALLNALGTTYVGLGLYAPAVRLHKQAGDVRDAAMGPDHPDTLKSRSNLANAFGAVGRLSEAIALHETTLGQREARFGRDHLDTLGSRDNLGRVYYLAGRFNEAIALHESTLNSREAKLGPDHLDTLGSRSNLANAYAAVGRLSEAIRLHKAVAETSRAKLGPGHFRTLNVLGNLAADYFEAGQFPEAIAIHKATLEIQEAMLGDDHPETLRTRQNLAVDYYGAGQLSEMVDLFEAVVKLEELKLGPDHPETLRTRQNLAEAYVTAGRIFDGIALNEATLRARQATLGPDHPQTLDSRIALALAYDAVGRRTAAEEHYRATLQHLRKAANPADKLLAKDLAFLGRHLMLESRWSEAEPLLREALVIREKLASDGWERFATMSLLGGSLLGQGRCDLADPLIVDGYGGLKARDAKIPVPERFHLREAGESVVRLFETWNKPREAAEWKAKLGMRDLPDRLFASP